MFLSMHHKPMVAEAKQHEVIDKDTGEKIPYVIWANDETGCYRRYLTDENGMFIIEGDHGKSRIFRGNIEIRKIVSGDD